MHGYSKEVQRRIQLSKGVGVEGAVHGGALVQPLYHKAKRPGRPNLRRVHLLEEELILKLNGLGFQSRPALLAKISRRGTSI
jgi:hypothetical protein